MLQRLRQISISSSLRGAFLTGALLTLIVSSVSLYSWHEQSSQIRYSLDEYFPRIHAAFLIEGNLNLVVDQLNEFLLAPNTTVRLQLRNQIIQHLDKIERLSQGLSPAERQQLGVILQDSRALLAELDRVLYNMFLVREKVGELAARIDWLHDDFTTELNSLVQDFTWQQGTLLDQIEARQGDARQYLKRAREVQNEQQQVYTLARIENQIVDDLRDRLNELKSGNDDGMLVETHIRYLENLKNTADENIRALDDWPSTITLRQTIDELLEIGMVKNNMPDTMRDYVSAQKALVEASRSREATLGRFRTLLEAQLGSSHQQMQMFNQRMAQIVRVSGGLILVATLLALLLALCMVFAFAACGKDPANPDPVDPSNPAGPVNPANPDDPTQPTKEEQLKELQKTMLENTLAMQQKNKDTIGWIYIDGTTVNDVVVKVNYNDDNKYYLRRNANGENDNDGCYYADWRCKTGNRNSISKNTVVYGHNLGRSANGLIPDYQNHANGPKFAQLLKYQDEEFAKTHPYIYYSTIEEDMVWQVFAVFYTDIKFDYIEPNPADATFNSLLKKAQDLSFYNYDIEVSSNDKILTLSTCTYRMADDTKLHYPNDYRYVVMAKLLPADAVLEDTVSLTVTKNAPVNPAGE